MGTPRGVINGVPQGVERTKRVKQGNRTRLPVLPYSQR